MLLSRIAVESVKPPDGYFAATNGRSGASGTIFDPFSLEYALGSSSPLKPGDTLWIRGGTYTPLTAGTTGGNMTDGVANTPGKGVYRLQISGTSGNNIVIRNFNKERVRINGAIHIVNLSAGYLTLRGLEIAASPTTRVYATRAACDLPGVYITAPGIWIDRCYIHDIAQMYVYGADNFLFTNNVIGRCGTYITAEWMTGYACYTHNANGSGMTFRNNVWIGGYNGYNFGAQSSGVNSIRNYTVEYNAFYMGGALWGSASGTDSNNLFRYNWYFAPTRPNSSYIYVTPLRSRGYDNGNCGEAWTVQYNQFFWLDVSTPIYYWPRQINFQYNRTVSPYGCFARLAATAHDVIEIVHDNNEYRTSLPGENRHFTHFGEPTVVTLARWRELTGWDTNSTHTIAWPSSALVRVLPDEYAPGYGFIHILNYPSDSNITVDISALGLQHGTGCRLYNCLNMNEYLNFVYDANYPYLTIPMTLGMWTVEEPYDHDAPYLWRTGCCPEFGAFLVEQR